MLQQERIKEWEEGKIKKSSDAEGTEDVEGAEKTADGGDDGDEKTTTFRTTRKDNENVLIFTWYDNIRE